jgi:hypothetical protein
VDHADKPIHAHRAGNEPGNDLPAVKKNVVLRRYLDRHPYGSVHMYDDSKTNLHHFLKLKKEYGLKLLNIIQRRLVQVGILN